MENRAEKTWTSYTHGQNSPIIMKRIYALFSALIIFHSLLITNAPTTSAKEFSDVQISDWFSPYIQEITDDEIMNGYPDGRFGPWDPINRAEMAKILSLMRKDLDSSWIKENVVSSALILMTLVAWISIIWTLRSISKRPIIIQYVNETTTPRPQPSLQKNHRVIAETPNQPMENQQLDVDFNQDESQKNHKTNWWM